jgi:hypothetical protein
MRFKNYRIVCHTYGNNDKVFYAKKRTFLIFWRTMDHTSDVWRNRSKDQLKCSNREEAVRRIKAHTGKMIKKREVTRINKLDLIG